MPGQILTRSHGLQLDHIALAGRDTEQSLAWLQKKTGAQPFTTEAEPGQWYWSGGLPLGEDSFLEVLGPNPAHRGFHPLKQLILGFDEPQLLFWYVATDDFDALAGRANAAGVPIERVETIDFERHGARVAYKRGIVGPGFLSERPCVIEWRHRAQRDHADHSVRLSGFELSHPLADEMNAVHQVLGIDIAVLRGPSWLSLVLDTPNGIVTLANPGQSFAGLSVFFRMAQLYIRYKLGGRH